jgi:signal transduction histidine kinase
VSADESHPILGLSGATGAWHWDFDRQVIYGDARFAALMGFSAQQAAGGIPAETLFSHVVAQDRLRLRIGVAGVAHGTELFAKDFRLPGKEGDRWVSARGRAEHDSEGRVVLFAGSLVDITEQKRTEERLRIVQTAGGVGTFEYVEGFGTVAVSEQFCRLLGTRPTDVLAVRTINSLSEPSETPLISGEGKALGPSAREVFIRRADNGEHRWLAVRGERREAGEYGGVRFIGVIYDVTEAKANQAKLEDLARTLEARVVAEVRERAQAEEALRQSQKMEAVGQLTGGIAHDFNNMLTGVIGGLDMVRRRLAEGRVEDASRFIEAALASAGRAAALTHRLLAFSRRQSLDPQAVDANHLIGSMEDLLRRTLGEQVDLSVDLATDLWNTQTDANQLESAILNLAINARDAMPTGGKLTIETANLHLDSQFAHTLGNLNPGDYVAISVSDTGQGMTPDVASRVFDPFFTTKPIGQGTGLGLSMVYGFVRQSEGRVDVYSELGVGTTVRLYLPRHDAPALEVDRRTPTAPPEGAGETVLVVEDDAQVRLLVVEVLKELGYRAIEVGEANSAIKIISSEVRIDLLITDVGLPGLNGRQLAEMARQSRGELPVLFMTGYAAGAARRSEFLAPGMDMISKPFAIDALALKIRETIKGG